MIVITPQIALRDDELELSYIASPGPGGQNVNKLATAVQLRFNVLSSTSLSESLRARLMVQLGSKLSKEGVLIIKASRFRTQDRNRQDALNRFIELIKKASAVPKKRKKTRPTAASRERRLNRKKQVSEKKAWRQKW